MKVIEDFNKKFLTKELIKKVLSNFNYIVSDISQEKYEIKCFISIQICFLKHLD